MTTPTNSPRGFLFIGDPHGASERPGYRLDDDFIGTVVGKLTESMRFSAAQRLIPVILGDLFHRARDTDSKLLVGMIRAFSEYPGEVLCLSGNHDAKETRPTDDTALGVLHAAKVVRVIFVSGPVAVFQFGSTRIGLGATLHGDDIPDNVDDYFHGGSTDGNVWITHHDIAFDGAYPGSIPTHPIAGCRLLVNGHMHATKPAVVAGETTWFNPGNITRLARSDSEHVPSVWAWTPDDVLPVQHILRYDEQVFDWSGLRVPTVAAGALAPTIPAGIPGGSVFVQQLQEAVGQMQAQLTTERPLSTGMEVLDEFIDTVSAELQPRTEVLQVITTLKQRVCS